MRVSDQQRQLDRFRLKFFLQRETQWSDAGAGIQHDDLAVCSQFNTGGIATVTQSLRTGHGYRAACPPKSDSGRSYWGVWHGGAARILPRVLHLTKCFQQNS